ncbi:MAG: VOC family protein [Planctomycetes bacterium]|nr:VOC family protein [Planctomycetota bacterium]
MTSARTTTGLRSIGYVILFVRDMQRSIAFYRDTLGIPVKMQEHNWTEFDMTGAILALHTIDGDAPPAPKPLADPSQKQGVAVEVVFTVDDPLGVRAAVVKSGVTVAPPKMVHEAGPSVGVSCLFEDPDGNLLSIYGLVPRSAWQAQGSRAS